MPGLPAQVAAIGAEVGISMASLEVLGGSSEAEFIAGAVRPA